MVFRDAERPVALVCTLIIDLATWLWRYPRGVPSTYSLVAYRGRKGSDGGISGNGIGPEE